MDNKTLEEKVQRENKTKKILNTSVDGLIGAISLGTSFNYFYKLVNSESIELKILKEAPVLGSAMIGLDVGISLSVGCIGLYYSLRAISKSFEIRDGNYKI